MEFILLIPPPHFTIVTKTVEPVSKMHFLISYSSSTQHCASLQGTEDADNSNQITLVFTVILYTSRSPQEPYCYCIIVRADRWRPTCWPQALGAFPRTLFVRAIHPRSCRWVVPRTRPTPLGLFHLRGLHLGLFRLR